jgi:P27 family predicted phage terminase small subunit
MRRRPPHAKRLKGALRPRRAATPAPGAALRRPPRAPATLGALGAAYWRASAALLVRDRRLRRCDLALLETLCVQYQRLRTAQAVIADRGLTMEVTTIEGEIIHKVRPEVLIAAAAETQFATLAQRFGLTPIVWAKAPERAAERAPEGWDDGEFG